MFKESLPTSVVGALRLLRQSAYLCLEPLDYASRLINGKGDLPPLRLRRHVGPLRSFEMSGAEFTAYLRLLCGLRPHERVLDVGCGCGLMALPLLPYLGREGGYTGVDIHRPSISWCRRNIGERHPNFTFEHIDVRSRAYNPGGRHAPEEYSFAFADGGFDLVLLKSVFTHMRPAGVGNYLREVSRVLSGGGRCLMTFFLLNPAQEELAQRGLNRIRFGRGEGVWRYVYPNSPESAVAYGEEHVLSLLRANGLSLAAPVIYGSWSGRADGLSYQDMLLVHKSRAAPDPA